MSEKVRINKYDNLKGIAIFLVVLMHLDFMGSLDSFITKFLILISMPLFFFASGYFSKIAPDQPIKAFRRLFIPYILFIIITNLFNFALSGTPIITKDMFVSNLNIFWFLIALFFMKMMLPIVDKFKYPLLTSIACALLIGFIDINASILGITRTVIYFPIFLLGFYYNDYKNKLKTEYTKYVELFKKYDKIIIIFSLIFIIATVYGISGTLHFLFKNCYNGNLLYELIKRVLIITSEILVVLLLNWFMTNRKSFMTKWGVNSMAVYILHYYVQLYLRTVMPNIFAGKEYLFIPFILIASFVVTIILSRDVVTKYLNKFTDLFYNFLVKAVD